MISIYDFNSISCTHVYRENNTKVDALYEDALQVSLVVWYLLESKDGKISQYTLLTLD
jgi:hypothetical protein